MPVRPAARLTRRRFLGAALLAGLGAAGYARWVEPRWLDCDEIHVPLGRTLPLRILHLSDLHVSDAGSLELVDWAIALGLGLRPDLAALTGDFITGAFTSSPDYELTLRRLAMAVPTFACLGNHDGGRWSAHFGGDGSTRSVADLLRHAGVQLLHNSAQSVHLGSHAIQLIGVGDLWAGECDPGVAFASLPTRGNSIRIVLSHNPDSKLLLQPLDWDLMLCGHAHGGQFQLPVIGTPFAPVSDKRFAAGLHYWQSRWIHTTRGVGNLHGLRLFCRPQVSLLVIE
ncbi:MAG TPA: phosphodiesterase YaeI [Opitutaceae bacterium]|nr:phosphodiesterase YaeI [Opitutaceae bacterium]